MKGVLLAPGGWVVLTVFAGPEAKPGDYEVPVRCRVGNREVIEKVALTVR